MGRFNLLIAQSYHAILIEVSILSILAYNIAQVTHSAASVSLLNSPLTT